MAREKIFYACRECGFESPQWVGKCPSCQSWNSLTQAKKGMVTTGGSQGIPLNEVQMEDLQRIPTCYAEFDRVLGGGAVPGSLVLVGGEPGVGKSTLLLKVVGELAIQASPGKVLYISGEESLPQIKARAQRIGVSGENLFLLNENSWEKALGALGQGDVSLLVLDSIQTTYSEALESAPGTLSQIRDVTYQLMKFCKAQGVTAFVVGHITKDGLIAGPKILEHMVDTVIYFEGDRQGDYRLLRAAKNRFGNTNEVGIFEMNEEGLREVTNPTQVFLQEGNEEAFGRSLSCVVEGSRALFLEIQALVVENKYGNGRRTTQGYDTNRLSMMVAIVEKYLGVFLNFSDIYLNVVGGIKMVGRETDLSVLASLLSSLRSRPIGPRSIFLGEVGLTGEVRGPRNIEGRLKEMSQLNYRTLLTSSSVAKKYAGQYPLEIIGLETIKDIDPLI